MISELSFKTEHSAAEKSKAEPMAFLDLKAQFAGIREEVMAAIAGVMESQTFILGPEVKKLEEEIAGRLGAQFAIGCASGTDALILALMAAGIGAGDEVITTPFSFIATANRLNSRVATRISGDFPSGRLSSQTGMTLIELIITCSILLILSSMALPVARYTIVREKEKLLRQHLREIRDAIDRFKQLSDERKLPGAGKFGYPPDLETLVKGVPLADTPGQVKTIRFLRRIPVDPMTGRADWGLRAAEDEKNALSWSGKDVFDVYSKSTAIAIDGSRYFDW